MARYIDADLLDDEYYELFHHGTLAVKAVLDVFKNLLDEQPTADVAEVVRCRECGFYQNGEYKNFCRKTGFETNADDFCSYGERREI